MPEPRDRQLTSVWTANATATPRAPLPGDLDTEVVVVGAGSTGLTVALRLAEAGHRVTVVEARGVAAGTTGGTTGKVTSQHGTIYADLVDRHGEDVARAYGRANEQALVSMRELCERHGIDAQLSPGDAFVYATDADGAETLREELAAAQRIGLPATWAETTELPFPVAGAVRFADQLQINAVSWCEGLADAVAAHDGCDVFTDTRVTRVRETGGRVELVTSRGTVTADHAILATLAPITDRGFEFARMTPVRAYGIAVRVDDESLLPEHMYIATGSPDRSIRHYHGDDGAFIVAVGASHDVGHETETTDNLAELEAFVRDRWGATDVAYRWSAQDMLPHDRLPLIGTTGFSRRIHVATGFQKWGLSNAFLAADVLTASLAGEEHPLADLLDPVRANITAMAREFLRHNTDVAKRYVADRVTPTVRSIDDIPAGGGATVRVDGKLLAVSKDETGAVTTRSAICSHLGCVVQWNTAERSWDCPCHGSRFDTDGTVLDGPAVAPLDEGPPGGRT